MSKKLPGDSSAVDAEASWFAAASGGDIAALEALLTTGQPPKRVGYEAFLAAERSASLAALEWLWKNLRLSWDWFGALGLDDPLFVAVTANRPRVAEYLVTVLRAPLSPVVAGELLDFLAETRNSLAAQWLLQKFGPTLTTNSRYISASTLAWLKREAQRRAERKTQPPPPETSPREQQKEPARPPVAARGISSRVTKPNVVRVSGRGEARPKEEAKRTSEQPQAPLGTKERERGSSCLPLRLTYVISDRSDLKGERLKELLQDWTEVDLDALVSKKATRKLPRMKAGTRVTDITEGITAPPTKCPADYEITFVWVLGGESGDLAGFDKRTYLFTCYLKNVLGNRKFAICDKMRLYENFGKHCPAAQTKHMMLSRNLAEVEAVREGEVLIARPVGRGFCSGREISVITDARGLTEMKLKSAKTGFDVIVSEYIRRPLLFNRKKFHLRLYFLVNFFPFFCELWDTGKILTAARDYIEGDWGNPQIHDTHMSSTPENWFWPRDIHFGEGDSTVKNAVQAQMQTIADCCCEILRKEGIDRYPESERAFEVFGIDVMITDDYVVKLIEVNDKVGYGNAAGKRDDPAFDDFSRRFFDWVYARGIIPNLPGT